jgi:hypothetical protein
VSQKTLRYFLFVGLAAVWGTIIYKVIKGLNQNDDIPAVQTSKGPKIDYYKPIDSFTLIANYPDPFLPQGDSTIAKNISENIVDDTPARKEALQMKPAIDVSKIQYYGMITNPEKKKKVAIISIAGKEYLAKEKEKIEQLLINKITKEKITVFINGKLAEINRQIN